SSRGVMASFQKAGNGKVYLSRGQASIFLNEGRFGKCQDRFRVLAGRCRNSLLQVRNSSKAYGIALKARWLRTTPQDVISCSSIEILRNRKRKSFSRPPGSPSSTNTTRSSWC